MFRTILRFLISEVVKSRNNEPTSRRHTIRQMMKGVSDMDTLMLDAEDRQRMVDSVRCMTATIRVKKKYR